MSQHPLRWGWDRTWVISTIHPCCVIPQITATAQPLLSHPCATDVPNSCGSKSDPFMVITGWAMHEMNTAVHNSPTFQIDHSDSFYTPVLAAFQMDHYNHIECWLLLFEPLSSLIHRKSSTTKKWKSKCPKYNHTCIFFNKINEPCKTYSSSSHCVDFIGFSWCANDL